MLTEVKEKFGTRAKLIDGILAAEKREQGRRAQEAARDVPGAAALRPLQERAEAREGGGEGEEERLAPVPVPVPATRTGSSASLVEEPAHARLDLHVEMVGVRRVVVGREHVREDALGRRLADERAELPGVRLVRHPRAHAAGLRRRSCRGSRAPRSASGRRACAARPTSIASPAGWRVPGRRPGRGAERRGRRVAPRLAPDGGRAARRRGRFLPRGRGAGALVVPGGSLGPAAFVAGRGLAPPGLPEAAWAGSPRPRRLGSGGALGRYMVKWTTSSMSCRSSTRAEVVEREREARVEDLEGAPHPLLGRQRRVDVDAVQPPGEPDRRAHAGDGVEPGVEDAPPVELGERPRRRSCSRSGTRARPRPPQGRGTTRNGENARAVEGAGHARGRGEEADEGLRSERGTSRRAPGPHFNERLREKATKGLAARGEVDRPGARLPDRRMANEPALPSPRARRDRGRGARAARSARSSRRLSRRRSSPRPRTSRPSASPRRSWA